MALLNPRSKNNVGASVENWALVMFVLVISGVCGYIVYDAVMVTASDLLQRLLIISPLLIVITVHWLSTKTTAMHSSSFLLPGSNPGDIHRAGGSPWGVAFVLLLLFVLISYQPSLQTIMS